MKVLVLGGTKYFGRHLVESLLNKNYEVYIFSRGNADLNFSREVKHIKGDRKIRADLEHAKSFGPYEFVFDQICWFAIDAKMCAEIFNGAVKKFIFTSSGSVYDLEKEIVHEEAEIDSKNFKITSDVSSPYDYQFEKNIAESYCHQILKCDVVCVRFPIVIGADDPSQRLFWHVKKIAEGSEIYFPKPDAKFTFIDSKDAGNFLALVAESTFSGNINAACDGGILLSDFIKLIEIALNKKAKLVTKETEENHSPYGLPGDFLMDNQKAKSLGMVFKDLKMTVGELISFYAKKC